MVTFVFRDTYEMKNVKGVSQSCLWNLRSYTCKLENKFLKVTTSVGYNQGLTSKEKIEAISL